MTRREGLEQVLRDAKRASEEGKAGNSEVSMAHLTGAIIVLAAACLSQEEALTQMEVPDRPDALPETLRFP